MHVTSVTREEVDSLRRAFDFYDHDHDGKINIFQFSTILRELFVEDPMFHSLLHDVVLECQKRQWVYFPELLGTLVRNRHNPFYQELWDRLVVESGDDWHSRVFLEWGDSPEEGDLREEAWESRSPRVLWESPSRSARTIRRANRRLKNVQIIHQL